MRNGRKTITDEKVFWNLLSKVYKLLATDEGQIILEELLNSNKIRSTDLLERTKLTESQFHPTMRQLVNCTIVDKDVGRDRSVTYNIGPFGKYILKLSKPLLAKIKKEFRDELIITN